MPDDVSDAHRRLPALFKNHVRLQLAGANFVPVSCHF